MVIQENIRRYQTRNTKAQPSIRKIQVSKETKNIENFKPKKAQP